MEETDVLFTEAYDLDGTLCEQYSGLLDKVLYKLFPNTWANFIHRRHKITPLGETLKGKVSLIITGRPKQDAEATNVWLRKHRIYAIVLFSEKWGKKETIAHKIRWLNVFKIKTYYENSRDIGKEIEKNTNTQVIYV